MKKSTTMLILLLMTVLAVGITLLFLAKRPARPVTPKGQIEEARVQDAFEIEFAVNQIKSLIK